MKEYGCANCGKILNPRDESGVILSAGEILPPKKTTNEDRTMTKIKSPALVAKEARIAAEKERRAKMHAEWNAEWEGVGSKLSQPDVALYADFTSQLLSEDD